VLLAVALVAASGACARQLTLIPADPPRSPSPPGPDSFVVAFETTRGTFSVIARRYWSPNGVDRFYDLVRRGFYDGVAVYRVIEGFVAQFGHTDSAAVNAAWRPRTFPDEPVVAENARGRVAFARGGPDSRNYQLFINLGDNSPRLDTLSVQGVVGYPPIGEVTLGMETVDAFEARWGNEPSMNQDSLAAGARAYLDRTFPGLDRILRASVTQLWR
jgi:cyclophilin family peptidyl-prolyl cis-trans isomerase